VRNGSISHRTHWPEALRPARGEGKKGREKRTHLLLSIATEECGKRKKRGGKIRENFTPPSFSQLYWTSGSMKGKRRGGSLPGFSLAGWLHAGRQCTRKGGRERKRRNSVSISLVSHFLFGEI